VPARPAIAKLGFPKGSFSFRPFHREKLRASSSSYSSESARAPLLIAVGAIKAIMRSFDESCLAVPGVLKPKQIKKLRERYKVGQPVFARFLNTSESTVEKWETGTRRPSGMALKLLSVVQKRGLKMLA
jgi:putative transcriptional regulator